MAVGAKLEAGQVSWIAGHAPNLEKLSAKTRYRQPDMACAFKGDTERFELNFDDAQWAVTPGQSAVLYDGDVCLGGGIINSAFD